ncbi:hypothetical protein NDU88_002573 [Pleurodeles waltl]|uniref:Uncharacterized protein n=1 Tax=Pleurodeles waltl TaxID=8319 RepID=A0AAV7LEH0_PLEWA|nr:hypothetical protein NDU88_002573 [Pleurodeles waltl]
MEARTWESQPHSDLLVENSPNMARGKMVKNKALRQSQTNKISNYMKAAVVKEITEEARTNNRQDCTPSHITQGQPLSDVMEAIKGYRSELVTKIDLIATDVNLLRADLYEVADRVTTTEENFGTLQ